MASEQMLRRGVYHETFLEVREVHIQKHGKNLYKNTAATGNDINGRNKGGDYTDNKQQHIGELQADRDNEAEEAKGVGGYMNKFEMKGVEEAAKGLKDRKDKETRDRVDEEHGTIIENNRCQKAMDDTIANAQEKAKQEARNKEEESEAKRVSQNKEPKERPSEKTTTKSFEDKQEQDQEGIEKSSVVCPPPQMANGNNTSECYQGVQENKAKEQGVVGETKIQHAEKMNKTDESLQSQEGGKRNKVYATYADAVKANDSTKSVQEQELNENKAEKRFEGKSEQPQDDVEQMVKESLDNKVTEGGSTVLGAVGETVAEIGENMIQPAKKVMEKSEEGKEGGVLGAIGETVAEIAETTKVLALGEGETESKQSIESHAK